jgi:LPXTG-motif cell wall-anchored protein
VDATQYSPGATVTFSATGFVCNEVLAVSLDPLGAIGSFNPSAEGTFSGSFPAPADPGGTYQLVADGHVEGCIATVTFEVVAPPTTTTTTTTTTTPTTTTTTPATTTTTPATTTTVDPTTTTTTPALPATTPTAPEATGSTTVVTTTTAAFVTPTTTGALPVTGSSDRTIAMVAAALCALSAGLALLVVSRRKPG